MRADDIDAGASLDISRSRLSFLGPEFLTWLYFHIDDNGGSVTVLAQPKGHDSIQATVLVGNKITIKPIMAQELCVSVASTMLDDCGEVLQAVKSGGLVYTLSFQAQVHEHKYEFTLNATDAAISQVKIIENFREDEEVFLPGEAQEKVKLSEEETFFLRLAAIEEIEAIVHALYLNFLKIRLSSEYATQLKRIQQQVLDGLQQRASFSLPTVPISQTYLNSPL